MQTYLHQGICVPLVSMSVKAVLLEAVTDLTTDASIAALKRFVARRGLLSVIHSDHGTNFVGADSKVSFVSCHVLYCANAQLGPSEILVSLSFSY